MKKLLIDTTGKEIGIGIFDNEKVLCERYIQGIKQYNQLLIPEIEKILKENNCDISDIDIFGATLGPGSFTGIRIGILTAKAFAHALKKRFYGIDVLTIMENSINVDNKFKTIYPVLDAKRGEIYTFDKNKKIIIKKINDFLKSIKKYDLVILLKQDKNILVELYKKDSKIIELEHIDLKVFNRLLIKNKNLFIQDNYLFPLYVRVPDAEEKLKKEKRQ